MRTPEQFDAYIRIREWLRLEKARRDAELHPWEQEEEKRDEPEPT